MKWRIWKERMQEFWNLKNLRGLKGTLKKENIKKNPHKICLSLSLSFPNTARRVSLRSCRRDLKMSLCCQGGALEKLVLSWHLSHRHRNPFPGLPGLFLLPGSGQEGSTHTGALGSVWQDPEEIRAVLKQRRIRHCQQHVSRCSMPQSLAVNSLGQRSVPSWGVEGTCIAPHETGIQIIAAAAVTEMINVFLLSFVLSVSSSMCNRCEEKMVPFMGKIRSANS